jgi:uncharacterized protein (TIGR02284 family)
MVVISMQAVKTEWITRKLNEIIERLKDREAALANAARRTDQAALKQALNEFSQERARFALVLQAEVLRFGGRPEDSGTFTGAMRRGFANLKSELKGDHARPEFEECHYLEFAALNGYGELLRVNELPAGLSNLLETQFHRTKAAVDFFRGLMRDREQPRSEN